MNRKIKLILYHRAILNPGGAEKLLIKEYLFLKKRKDVKVKLLTFKYNKDAIFDLKPSEIIIIKMKSDIAKSFKITISDIFKRIKEIIILRKYLLSFKPDLVRCNSGNIELFLATIFTGIPYVLQVPATGFLSPKDDLKYALIHKASFNTIWGSLKGHKEFIPKNKKFSLLKRLYIEIGGILNYLSIRKAKVIFTHTQQVWWEIKVLFRKNSVILKGAIDKNLINYKPKINLRKDLKINPRDKIFLSVSRLEKIKRKDLLIKAFANLCKKYDNIFLLIIGKGNEEKYLKKLVESLKIINKVKFLGYIKEEILPEYYNLCDIFVSTSFADFEISPFEALLFKKIIVCSSEMKFGLPKGENIILAEPTIKNFENALELALNKKIINHVNILEYTWEKYFYKIYNIYKNLIYGKNK